MILEQKRVPVALRSFDYAALRRAVAVVAHIVAQNHLALVFAQEIIRAEAKLTPPYSGCACGVAYHCDIVLAVDFVGVCALCAGKTVHNSGVEQLFIDASRFDSRKVFFKLGYPDISRTGNNIWRAVILEEERCIVEHFVENNPLPVWIFNIRSFVNIGFALIPCAEKHIEHIVIIPYTRRPRAFSVGVIIAVKVGLRAVFKGIIYISYQIPSDQIL